MEENWIKRWDDRYRSNEYAFGEEPNNYLKEQLEKLDYGAYFFLLKGKGVMLFLPQNWDGKFPPLISV